MRKRAIANAIVVSLFFVTMAGGGMSGEPPAPTVALIAGPGLDPILSLLEVRLSEGDRLRLVERRELDRVLQEHRLTAAGLVDRQTVAATGRLLRADAMVLISLEDGAQPLRQTQGRLVRVRVAETAHGLRLWEGYEALEATQAEAAAARIAQKVQDTMEKIARPDGDSVPVGIVDIHRVELDERYEMLARTLPKLLSARLGGEPRILVLEREDLGLLLKEKQLTEGEDSAFWDSGILIDGRLQRSAGRLEMALRWRRAAGEGSIVAPVDPNAPARAVDTAAAELLKAAVATSSSSRWEPQKEAQEFFRQGMLLRAHSRQENAFAPLETAYALQPETTAYIGALFENEWELRGYAFASYVVRPTKLTHYADTQLAELVSLLVRSVRRDWESGSLSAGDFLDERNRPAWIRSGQWSYFAHRASVSSPEIRAMNRENRRIWCEVTEQAMKSQPTEKQFRIGDLDGRAALPWISSDDPQEVMAEVRRVYGELILPPAQGGTISSPDVRSNACERCLLTGSWGPSAWALRDSHFCGCETQIKTLWLAYIEELSRFEDPVLRFFAYAAMAEGAGLDSPVPSQTVMAFWWKAVKILTEELHGPSTPLADQTKWRICLPMKPIACKALVSDPCEWVATWERVFEPLIKSRNVRALVWWDPGSRALAADADGLTTQAAERFHSLLVRIEDVLATDGEPVQVNATLSRVRNCRIQFESPYGMSTSRSDRSTIQVTTLLKRTGQPPQPSRELHKVEWQLDGEMLYLAAIELWGLPTLARVDLTGRTPACLLKTETTINWNNLVGLAVMDDVGYLALRDIGIAVLPKNAWNDGQNAFNPKILTREQGLPSLLITAMAQDHGRLWIAYGRPDAESGLGLYDPKTGRWESVLCSTLKGEEPFNAGRPYGLMQLAVVPPNSVFFTNRAKMFQGMAPWMGLWRLDTTTHSVRYYRYCGVETGIFGRLEAVGKDLWCRGNLSLVRIDTESEEASYIFGTTWRPSTRKAFALAPWLDCRNDLFLPEDSMPAVPFGSRERGGIDLTSSAMYGDDLWTLLGNTQIAVIHRGKLFAEATILANDLLDGEPVLKFLSTPYGLVAIGDGAVGLVRPADRPQASQK